MSLALGNFDPGQPVPKAFPDRTVLIYVAAIFMLFAGAAIEWLQTVAWAAGALTAYYTLIVVVLMDGRSVLRNAKEFMAYSNTAEQVAIAAAGLIVFATYAKMDAKLAAQLTRTGQIVGLCAILFGGAHFFYMGMTARLVPRWLPPSQDFWGYATGVAHVAAGVAIIALVEDRLAEILLTVMSAAFTPLKHVPLFLADSHNHAEWAENAANLVLTGCAWVVADSLPRRRRPEGVREGEGAAQQAGAAS
ncbi:hypothetical protein [Phenylobacterium sp.]|uniref:hypothetical protein n=1 Tax=Phenylobacterium sp. TaxID=1871053 RepID=UPI00120991A0|nr:hypothetical protein [Phenylobacterium sp.]THD59053.1 MAG: hypothetical protein E8A49_17345 [Phenylobacterium sp.]